MTMSDIIMNVICGTCVCVCVCERENNININFIVLSLLEFIFVGVVYLMIETCHL